jgi:hypothetical protein
LAEEGSGHVSITHIEHIYLSMEKWKGRTVLYA